LESQAQILKQKALAYLGETNTGFRKSEYRTKHADRLVKNWKYVLYPMPIDERELNPEFRKLVEKTYDDVNCSLKNGSIELNYTRCLEILEKCRLHGITITVVRQRETEEEKEDRELALLMSQVQKEIK
jgi:hypothetical protein